MGLDGTRHTVYYRFRYIGFLVMGKDMTIGSKEAFDEVLEHLQVPLIIVP
jgi:hypothetical protein